MKTRTISVLTPILALCGTFGLSDGAPPPVAGTGLDRASARQESHRTAALSIDWTDRERETIRSLWLASLPPLPPDPSNQYADDERAALLGQRLFFDTALSANGEVSCGTCHRPELGFQDGLPLGRGVGITDRRTMPIAGTAYSPWQFWDGRKDSQWAQALGPLESAVEHGGDRTFYVHEVARRYRSEYEEIFGPLPALEHLPTHAGPVDAPLARAAWETLPVADRELVTSVFVNIGKSIAAYERRLSFAPSRFDAYAESVVDGRRSHESTLSPDEEAGLRLFIGKAGCVNCHNGPLFTDDFFHNTGVPRVKGLPRDRGRADGARHVREDEFNCLSRFSDATPRDCAELRFMVTEGDELVRAFKTPGLRGVAGRAPYMHAGQYATLTEVVAHYDRAPRSPEGRSELKRLRLTEAERSQIRAFLESLEGSIAGPSSLLAAPAVAETGTGLPGRPDLESTTTHQRRSEDNHEHKRALGPPGSNRGGGVGSAPRSVAHRSRPHSGGLDV